MKNIRKYFLVGLTALALLVMVPPGAFADDRGGGGGGGGSGGSGGNDLPSLQALLQATSDTDPGAYGQASASANQLGDGQSSSLEIHGVYSVDQVSVYINGGFLGYVDIDEYGDGGSLYTIGYYGGVNPVNLPIIHVNDEMEVYDAAGTTMLLIGTFQ